MNYNDIIHLLEVNCPFPEVFEEPERLQLGASYRRKIVHIRADYDGSRWWNTIWRHHNELATLEIRNEIDAVYDALTAAGAFPDLDTLTAFCRSQPSAKVNANCSDEFNFYFIGERCCYWLRCICRPKNYNLYLHAFLKDGKTSN